MNVLKLLMQDTGFSREEVIQELPFVECRKCRKTMPVFSEEALSDGEEIYCRKCFNGGAT